MIIDSHVHLWSENFIAKPFWDNWVRLSGSLSNKPSHDIREKLTEFFDESGKLLLKDMDNAGIEQSWISVVDFGMAKRIGEANYSIAEVNKKYAEIAQRNSNRIIAFAGFDPRREMVVKLLETAVKEWGMKGLKLLPAAGFYPNDEKCYKLYAKAEELRIPVIVHTGPEIIPLYSKYCYPIYLDEVANDFPKLKLIIAHAGFCWWLEAMHIAATKPNIYLDLAGWQPRTLRHPVTEFYEPLRIMIDTIGSSRVLFGSDWPAYRFLKGGQSYWVKAFTDLPDIVKKSKISFAKDEIDAVLGKNAAMLLSQ